MLIEQLDEGPGFALPPDHTSSSWHQTHHVSDPLTCEAPARCLLGLTLLDGDKANCQHLESACHPSAPRRMKPVICHNESEEISISPTWRGGSSCQHYLRVCEEG